MGWWEDYSSGKRLISGLIWYIEDQIESWVKSWAEWGASHANNYFSILNHNWSDVRNLINDKTGGFYSSINDFYSSLQSKLESSYSILNKSWYNVTSYVDDAISGFQRQINDLSTSASSLYTYAHTTLKNEINGLSTSASSLYTYAHTTLKNEINGLSTSASSLYTYAHTTLKNEINGLSQDMDNINDSLNIVTRTALATVNYIAIESEKRWGILKKSWGDVTVLVSNTIATLKTDTIVPIITDLSVLSGKFNTLIGTTIKQLQSDLSTITISLNKLTNDVLNPLKADLTALTTVVNGFPAWITKTFDDISGDILEQLIKIFNASEDTSVRFLTALGIGAGEVITTILDTPKDMVTWIKNDIADVFEDILDRVFK